MTWVHRILIAFWLIVAVVQLVLALNADTPGEFHRRSAMYFGSLVLAFTMVVLA